MLLELMIGAVWFGLTIAALGINKMATEESTMLELLVKVVLTGLLVGAALGLVVFFIRNC